MGDDVRPKTWLAAHPRILSLIVPVVIGVGYFAYQMWKIADAIPPLPTGQLQMVGASSDGARFIMPGELNKQGDSWQVTVLVAMNHLQQPKEGNFRFEVKKERIDCTKRQIMLEGASFYDDQGNRTISRIFDEKPHSSEPIDTETEAVCDHQSFSMPAVVGYRAALAQTQAFLAHFAGSR